MMVSDLSHFPVRYSTQLGEGLKRHTQHETGIINSSSLCTHVYYNYHTYILGTKCIGTKLKDQGSDKRKV